MYKTMPEKVDHDGGNDLVQAAGQKKKKKKKVGEMFSQGRVLQSVILTEANTPASLEPRSNQ